MNGPLIIIPQMIPPGQRVYRGQRTSFPTCDRCHRESSDRNPVMLDERKPWDVNGIPERRDAVCYECRLALQGRL